MQKYSVKQLLRIKQNMCVFKPNASPDLKTINTLEQFHISNQHHTKKTKRGTRAGQKVKSKTHAIHTKIGYRPNKTHYPRLPSTLTVVNLDPPQLPHIENRPNKETPILRTMVVNFQSMLPKQAIFWHNIQELKPDIIIGTETWLKPNTVHDSEVIPDELGYKLTRKERSDGWGGIFIATKNTLSAYEVPLKPDHDEVVLVKIETPRNERPLTVGAIYRRPKLNSFEEITELTNCLHNMNINDILWLGGDTNLPSIDWAEEKVKSNPQYPVQVNQTFLNKICDLGLTQVVDTATRGQNTLDTFFTNRPALVHKAFTIPGISDHDIVIIDNCLMTQKVEQILRPKNLWSKANEEEIKRETKLLSDSIVANENISVEDAWSKISHHLLKMMKDHVPTKMTSKRFNQPWITHKLKKLSRRKKKAWKMAKRRKTTAYWERFKELKIETQKENRRAYQNFVRRLLNDNPKKDLWKFVKSKKCDQIGVGTLTNNGQLITTNQDKANILNNQFCSVFTREELNNIPDVKDVTDIVMPDISVNKDGVQKLLANLDHQKASGPDDIPSRLLQLVSKEIAPALTKIFQLSLDAGTLPKIWKHARVQPIFKKGNRGDPANYRPISLTCICCKLLEHIVRSEITKHLEQNNLISEKQHGFRKGKSCETQLISILHDLATSLDKGGQTDAVLLDFSKAFDKVPHQRLLRKLNAYGIKNKNLIWIESFLKDRTQEVVVSGQMSTVGDVTSGVPQGSVLGPTLFLVYINDIGDEIVANVRLFADDTILYKEIKNEEDATDLNEDLAQLQAWEQKWQMEFNTKKCNVLTFTNKVNAVTSEYHLHGEKLQHVPSAKYLGVELTGDLSWSKHVTAICNKANKTLGFLMRNLKGCPSPILLNCYKSLVRPMLEYADTVWDPHLIKDITNVERIQKRAARRVTKNFSRETASTQLVRGLGLETMQERRKLHKCTMFYKITNKLVDIDPPNILRPPIRCTRGHDKKITVPQSRINAHLYSYYPSTIRLWNSLPCNVVKSRDVKNFQKSLSTVDWSSQ